MTIITVLLLLLISSVSSAQEMKEVKTFHRLLILNEQDELMVVKIKGKDVWVTPGLYQIAGQYPMAGMDSIAETYGLMIDPPELRGIFSLTEENSPRFDIRNVYVTHCTGKENLLPEIIEEVRWLTVEEAIDSITFGHINMMVRQIMNRPNAVWGGGVEKYKEDGVFKARVEEEFYMLFGE